MSSIKEMRIEQLQRTLKREGESFFLWAIAAGIGYAISAYLGPTGFGWSAFVFAVVASFLALGTAVNMASYELEKNLIEGPRID